MRAITLLHVVSAARIRTGTTKKKRNTIRVQAASLPATAAVCPRHYRSQSIIRTKDIQKTDGDPKLITTTTLLSRTSHQIRFYAASRQSLPPRPILTPLRPSPPHPRNGGRRFPLHHHLRSATKARQILPLPSRPIPDPGLTIPRKTTKGKRKRERGKKKRVSMRPFTLLLDSPTNPTLDHGALIPSSAEHPS